MHSVEKIGEIFSRYGGIMRWKELQNEHINASTLRRFEEMGLLFKVRPGYYAWIKEATLSEAHFIARIFPEAVLCMSSALLLHGYTDRVPRHWHLAVSPRASLSKFRQTYPRVKAHVRTEQSLRLGITDMVMDGQSLRLYDRERTICDCIKYRNSMDSEIFAKAIRAYCADPDHNIRTLMHYARTLHLEAPTQQLIGIWL